MALNKTYWKVKKVSSKFNKSDDTLKVTMVKVEDGDNKSSSSPAQEDTVDIYFYDGEVVKKNEQDHAHINDQWKYAYCFTDEQGAQQAQSFNNLKATFDEADKTWTFTCQESNSSQQLNETVKKSNSAKVPFYKTKGARGTAKALFWTGVVVATTALLALAGVALVALIASGAFGVAAAATVVTAATAMGAAVALAAITNLVANATVFSIATAAALAIVAVGGAYISYKGGKALVGYIKKKYAIYIDDKDEKVELSTDTDDKDKIVVINTDDKDKIVVINTGDKDEKVESPINTDDENEEEKSSTDTDDENEEAKSSTDIDDENEEESSTDTDDKSEEVVVYFDVDDKDEEPVVDPNIDNRTVPGIDETKSKEEKIEQQLSNLYSSTDNDTAVSYQQVPGSAPFSLTPNNFFGTQGVVTNIDSGTTADTKEVKEEGADQQAPVFSFNG
ncbi:MAG: hypothetical protein ACX932_05505 [Gammaproteobacteria bacterium]